MARLNSLFTAFLTIAASTQKLGINLIRVAILVIFVWIGGLKFWNYEACLLYTSPSPRDA